MHRLSLSNKFMEGSNNVYLFDGERTVLVDTGFDSPKVREDLERKLGEHGIGFGDVDDIVLTHYHIDHCALAATVQRAGGATVHAHPTEIPLVEGNQNAWSEVLDTRHRMYDLWGIPEPKWTELKETMIDESASYDQDITLCPIEAGDELDIGETTLEAMFTPGHTAGHLAFVLQGRDEVISGDALLPHYTPNVGGADVRVEHPLEKYLATLAQFRDGSFRRAWPGHRDPIDDPADRARTIVEHHEERAWRIASSLRDRETATPWEVSSDLFGDLENVHILHGPGEVYAHLDHLSREGAVERVEDGFRLTGDGADRLDSLSDETWPLA